MSKKRTELSKRKLKQKKKKEKEKKKLPYIHGISKVQQHSAVLC
ncbi:MAG TPA: hypothetical protein VF884_13590 [Nitrososphaeraceae archaeon]